MPDEFQHAGSLDDAGSPAGVPPADLSPREGTPAGDLGSHPKPPRPPRRSAPGPKPELARPQPRIQTVRQWVAAFGFCLFVGCALALVFRAPAPSDPLLGQAGRSSARLPSSGTIVVLDPGHGGADSGAVAFGMVEKELTLDIARRVAAALERQGVPIRLTRDTDHYVPLAARARFANGLPNAVFVSIHLNHARNAPASGIETFYTERKEPMPALILSPAPPAGALHWLTWLFGGSPAPSPPSPPRDESGEPAGPVPASRALAGCIQAKLVTRTAATDRGVKERRLYVTRHVAGPAVLVEGGFVSNPAEARLLADPAYRQRVGESIAEGIIEYLADAASHPRVPPKNVLAVVE